jgi:hypothetical protein
MDLDQMQTLRNLVWDTVPCDMARDFMPVCGLVPGSDDVTDMEHRESHDRLGRLQHLGPRLYRDCEAATRVITAIMLRRDLSDETDPGIVEFVEAQNAAVIHKAVLAILAGLVADGTVKVGDS